MTDYLELALGPDGDSQPFGRMLLRLSPGVRRAVPRPDVGAAERSEGPGTHSVPGPDAGTTVPTPEAAGKPGEADRAGAPPIARTLRAAEVLMPRWDGLRRAARWVERAEGPVSFGTGGTTQDTGADRDLDTALRALDRTVEREARCYDAGYTLY